MSTLNNMTEKKILFVTGTRADYGKLEPLAMSAQRAGFKIGFFITGMHMMRRYGETRHEVKRFDGAEFFEFVNQKEGDSLDFVLSKTILGFSDFVHEHRPDLVVIHGDRVEALAASIVCAMRYIRSAHIEGGEVSGTIDESIRHCNTKLCSTHFVCSDSAFARVNSLGEPIDRIFNIGSPELDTHMRDSGVHISEVKRHYQIDFEEYGIAVFHPVTSEISTIGEQANSLFSALLKSGKSYVIIAPNNDPGTDQIFSIIDTLPSHKFRIIPSMRFNYFSELMKNASLMIGNSSAGVREAPFLGLPSINVGTRQNRRTDSSLVRNVSAFNSDGIVAAIEELWGHSEGRSTEFGAGDAAERFVQVLESKKFWDIGFQKEFVDD